MNASADRTPSSSDPAMARRVRDSVFCSTPAETAQVLLDAMTYADEDGGEPYFHDEIVCADGLATLSWTASSRTRRRSRHRA